VLPPTIRQRGRGRPQATGTCQSSANLGKAGRSRKNRLGKNDGRHRSLFFRLDPDQRHAGLVNKCRHNLINGLAGSFGLGIPEILRRYAT